MTIFNNLYKIRCFGKCSGKYFGVIISVILSLLSTNMYAEVSLNSDKVGAGQPVPRAVPRVAEQTVPEKGDPAVKNGQPVLHKSVDTGSKVDNTADNIIDSNIDNKTDNKADAWILRAEQWEIARSGESVLSLPVLNKVVNAWLKEKQKTIEIQYPGGEEGEFWVQELTDWLVSLGVPSSSMQTVPGSGADDMIKFQLSRNGS